MLNRNVTVLNCFNWCPIKPHHCWIDSYEFWIETQQCWIVSISAESNRTVVELKSDGVELIRISSESNRNGAESKRNRAESFRLVPNQTASLLDWFVWVLNSNLTVLNWFISVMNWILTVLNRFLSVLNQTVSVLKRSVFKYNIKGETWLVWYDRKSSYWVLMSFYSTFLHWNNGVNVLWYTYIVRTTRWSYGHNHRFHTAPCFVVFTLWGEWDHSLGVLSSCLTCGNKVHHL